MSIGFAKPVEPASIPERRLWTLTKQTRVVEARVRTVPLGPELRLYVDGELVWSLVVRPAEQLDARSAHERQVWQAEGWQ